MQDFLSFIFTEGSEAASRSGLILKEPEVLHLLPQTDVSVVAAKLAETEKRAALALQQEKEKTGIEYNSQMTRLRDIKKKMDILDEGISKANNFEDAFKRKKSEIDQVFKNLLIRHVQFVPEDVVIFTTELLKREDIILGIFRIWLDFNRSTAASGVRILNVYHRSGHLDHPCVDNGVLCMGNAASTIEKHFKEKNVFVLLETLISFLSSQGIGHGYIRDWGTWKRQVQRVRPTLSFADIGVRPSRAPAPRSTNSADELIREAQRVVAAEFQPVILTEGMGPSVQDVTYTNNTTAVPF